MIKVHDKVVYAGLGTARDHVWVSADDVVGVITNPGFKGCVVVVDTGTGRTMEIRANVTAPAARAEIAEARKLQTELREAVAI